MGERPASSQPVFVIGFQRSGTTLLQSLLGAHPRIAAPPEVYYVARVLEHADHFGDLGDDANLAAALHEALNPPLDMLSGCGFDEERLLERARGGPRTYAALLEAILSDFAERQGKARWSEKSAGQPIAPVLKMFPDARIIHILRDPRDVVASSMEVAWTRPESAVSIAHQWRSFTINTIWRGADLGPAQYMQIRYEDLARDPATVMRMVCAFLGEEYDPAMVDDVSRRRATVPQVAQGWQGRALARIQPPARGEWARRLARSDQLRVNAVVDTMLKPLGYRPADETTRALSVPFKLPSLAQRARVRLRSAPPELSPEERYEQKRRFLEQQAGRVRDAAAERDA